MTMMAKGVYTPHEIASQVRVPLDKVEGWLETGRLHGTRTADGWRITEANLEAFVQELRGQQAATDE